MTPSVIHPRDPRSPLDGGTVLLTGASAGIGLALAHRLAPRAARLLLVARRRERLEALRRELGAAHPRLRVEAIACDLAHPAQRADALGPVLARGEIDVVISNAGASRHGAFAQQAWPEIEGVADVNAVAPLWLARQALPGMLQRGRGGLLAVGSGAGLAPMPFDAAYSGSKHLLHGWLEALRIELRGTGVRVTEVCPGPVESEFDAVAGMPAAQTAFQRAFRISSAQCADEAIQGFDRGAAMVYPGRAYRAFMILRQVLPIRLQRAMLAAAAAAPAPGAGDTQAAGGGDAATGPAAARRP